MNLSIIVGCKCAPSRNGRPALFSTRYNRWRIEYRPFLFPNLRFAASELIENLSSIPKMGECLETALLHKVMAHVRLERHESDSAGAERIFYHSGGRYFRKCLRERLSNEYKELKVGKGWGNPLISLLSSSFYYWFWIAISDCYHVTRRDIDGLPAPVSLRDDKQLDLLATRLLQDLWKNAEKRTRQRADGTHKDETNFDVGKSKYIIDDIDRVLARHFNLSREELDFLINRDIAFRGEDSDA